jgi:autotransporter-associated beta strand protein
MNKISALRSGKFHSALVASALLALSSPLAAQTTYTWDNGTNTSVWGTSANWVGDPALTFNNQTAIIFNDASVVNDATAISIGGAKTINSLTINADFFTAATNGSSFDIRTRSTLSAGSAAANLTFDATAGNNASITVAQSTSGIGQVRLGDNGGGSVVLNTNLDLAQHNTFFGVTGFQFETTVSGVGTINKTGVGEVRFVRQNTNWSGGLNINEGNVTIAASPNAMGTGTWTIGGGTNNTSLSVATSVTYSNVGGLVVAAGAGTRTIRNYNAANQGNPVLSGAITLNKDVIFDITAFTNGTVDRITFSGAIGGTGGIIKTGTGISILSASNNYSGTTDIQGGKLYLAGAGRLGSGAVTISNGANVDFATGSGQTNIVANNISGAGLILQNVAGTDTRFTGDVTSTGGMTINTGTVRIGNGTTTGSYSGDATVASGAALAFARSNAYTHSGAISGAGNVSKTAAGEATLTASNSYSGVTTLFSGALVADHANALGTGNITFNPLGGNTGSIRYTAASAGTDWASRIKNSTGTIRLDTDTNNVTLAGVIDSSNVNGLTKSGNGTLTLGGANAYTGGTTISAGTLQFSDGGSVGGNITNNATLSINRTDSSTLSNAVSGSGSLTKAGAGTLTLSGANTYTGATIVAGGTLRIDGNSRLGNTTNTLAISNAGVLEVTAAGTLTNAITIGAGNGVLANSSAGALVVAGAVEKNGTVLASRSGSGTNVFTGVISGASANSDFIVDGGTTVFSNVMTYNGPTIITNGGTLVLAVDDAMPSGSNLILGGGTFRVGVLNYNADSALSMGTLTLTADSTIDLGNFGTSGDRNLVFADSSGPSIVWTPGAVLTITNWQGVALAQSDVTKLLFGTGGLDSDQLAQIRFADQNITGGVLLGLNGELSPIPEADIVYAALALALFILWRERRRLLHFVRSVTPPRH